MLNGSARGKYERKSDACMIFYFLARMLIIGTFFSSFLNGYRAGSLLDLILYLCALKDTVHNCPNGYSSCGAWLWSLQRSFRLRFVAVCVRAKMLYL